MTTSDSWQDKVFKEVLEARMNTLYHGKLELRYATVDRRIRLAAAIFSASAVGSFGLWETSWGQWVWATLTVLVAVASAYQATASPADKAKANLALRQRWIGLNYKLNSLLGVMEVDDLPAKDAQKRLDELMAEKVEIEQAQPPAIQRFLVWAQEQTRIQMGLANNNRLLRGADDEEQ